MQTTCRCGAEERRPSPSTPSSLSASTLSRSRRCSRCAPRKEVAPVRRITSDRGSNDGLNQPAGRALGLPLVPAPAAVAEEAPKPDAELRERGEESVDMPLALALRLVSATPTPLLSGWTCPSSLISSYQLTRYCGPLLLLPPPMPAMDDTDGARWL